MSTSAATAKGEKKDFSVPMADAYDPAAVEASWDSFWEQNNLYKPTGEGEKFVIVLPPPNVTGTLHLGHALTAAIQDSVVRWHRMNGKDTLWVPGIDHAGIATQVVVEKQLARTQGLSRHDLGREKFIEEVWKWKEEHGDRIFTQMRSLGASVDWSRSRFTMDEICARAVKEAFVRMHQNKQIYRANRIVSWSCALRSAISSIEVDHIEVPGSTMVNVPNHPRPVEIGVLHSFAYKVKGSDEELVISTTRIETMLGDVAVAVHPADERYKHLIGKELVHPFLPDRKIVVIADDVLVDMAFGTGAVKITPAHDPNDFLCGQRHNLPRINILDDAGFINANGGDKYAGKHRFEVRELIIEDLKAVGLYRKKENNPMAVGICSRSKDIVEPIIRPQWWVDCKEMADRAIKAAKEKDLVLLPGYAEQTWYRWLENIQDWCISRQLWWGHRIPAFYALKPTDSWPVAEEDESRWIIADDKAAAEAIAAERFGAGTRVEQDDDVLDTWFSSGLFPFSVMGWPEKTPDMEKYFPGHLLETGSDILFFWVARMVMMSLALTDKLPFNTVYLHSLVRDRIGRKMSKSLGNVIDPLDVVTGVPLAELQKKLENGNLDPKEVKTAQDNQAKDFPNGIPQCGADALRFGLLGYTRQGTDINLDINRLYVARTFCNKMWQATRFALMNFPEDFDAPASLEAMQAHMAAAGGATTAQKWILSRLHAAADITEQAFVNYEFGNATVALQSFFVDELCSRYLEVIKPIVKIGPDASEEAKLLAQSHLSVLFICLDYFLRLLHPMMPFVTEELYHRLPGHAARTAAAVAASADARVKTGSIMIAPYPRAAVTAMLFDTKAETDMALLDTVISTIRSSKANVCMTNKHRPDVYVVCKNDADVALLSKEAKIVSILSFTNKIVSFGVAQADQVPEGCLSAVVNGDITLYMTIDGMVDVASEVVKNERKLKDLQAQVDAMIKTMENPNYGNIKEEVRVKNAATHASNLAELESIQKAIANFSKLVTRASYIPLKIADIKRDVEKAEKNILKNKATIKPPKEGEEPKPVPKKTLDQIEKLEQEKIALESEIAVLAAELESLKL